MREGDDGLRGNFVDGWTFGILPGLMAATLEMVFAASSAEGRLHAGSMRLSRRAPGRNRSVTAGDAVQYTSGVRGGGGCPPLRTLTYLSRVCWWAHSLRACGQSERTLGVGGVGGGDASRGGPVVPSQLALDLHGDATPRGRDDVAGPRVCRPLLDYCCGGPLHAWYGDACVHVSCRDVALRRQHVCGLDAQAQVLLLVSCVCGGLIAAMRGANAER